MKFVFDGRIVSTNHFETQVAETIVSFLQTYKADYLVEVKSKLFLTDERIMRNNRKREGTRLKNEDRQSAYRRGSGKQNNEINKVFDGGLQ